MESDFFFFCNYSVGVLCRINLSERKRERRPFRTIPWSQKKSQWLGLMLALDVERSDLALVKYVITII